MRRRWAARWDPRNASGRCWPDVPRAGSPGRVVDQAIEFPWIEDAHVALVDGEQPSLVHRRECAADRLQLDPEVAADLPARHAQVEVGAGIAARLEPLREVQEEG